MDFLPALTIADYTYVLPNARIAEQPVIPKHNSKLLIYRDGEIHDSIFLNIGQNIPSNSRLVFNNTKVIPARLIFQLVSGQHIEIFLLSPKNDTWTIWECLVGNRKKFQENDVLSATTHGSTLQVNWLNRDSNTIQLTSDSNLSMPELIDVFGRIPLPPYIKREAQQSDTINYQTVFAQSPGAVAAPTASLHFTNEVVSDIQNRGIAMSEVTLHVGLGTFKPVTATNTAEHDMHTEKFIISQSFVEALLSDPQSLIPSGTTSMRVLESLFYVGASALLGLPNPHIVTRDVGFNPIYRGVDTQAALEKLLLLIKENGGELSGETSIFILPGFPFKLSSGLITNFHQPNSTLLLLVAAFVGDDWQKIYNHALDNNYRFLSYGDASLLFPKKT